MMVIILKPTKGKLQILLDTYIIFLPQTIFAFLNGVASDVQLI